jgi:hypothetical protein
MPPIAGYFLIIIGALCIAGGVALLRQQPTALPQEAVPLSSGCGE